jgi:hypothetical protein
MEPTETADDYQREADFLAGLLEHPDIPSDFDDYIADVVCEIAGNVSLFTPEVLRVAWPLIRRQQGNEGEGVFSAIKMALKTFADEKSIEAMNAVSKSLYEARCAVQSTGGEWPDVIGDTQEVI